MSKVILTIIHNNINFGSSRLREIKQGHMVYLWGALITMKTEWLFLYLKLSHNWFSKNPNEFYVLKPNTNKPVSLRVSRKKFVQRKLQTYVEAVMQAEAFKVVTEVIHDIIVRASFVFFHFIQDVWIKDDRPLLCDYYTVQASKHLAIQI